MREGNIQLVAASSDAHELSMLPGSSLERFMLPGIKVRMQVKISDQYKSSIRWQRR